MLGNLKVGEPITKWSYLHILCIRMVSESLKPNLLKHIHSCYIYLLFCNYECFDRFRSNVATDLYTYITSNFTFTYVWLFTRLNSFHVPLFKFVLCSWWYYGILTVHSKSTMFLEIWIKYYWHVLFAHRTSLTNCI